MPSESKSVPVRVETPLLAANLSDWRRLTGTDTVTPRRSFDWALLFSTPFVVVVPPL
jgi:hypothetical protein